MSRSAPVFLFGGLVSLSRDPSTPAPDDAAELRVDKWLWFCRFYKSRSQATTAVSGGLVHVNGERVKASRGVRVSDVVSITRDEIRIVVEVLGFPVRRGPAAEAQRCYRETEDSAAARERVREARRLAPPAPDSRPDKHDRRLLRRLRGRHDA